MAGDLNFRDHDILPLISALNLVLQQHPIRSGAIRVGKNRHFFPSREDIHSLGMGVDVWKGFYTSVRPAYNQLMVNVNVCMTAFYAPGNLADIIQAFKRTSFGAMPNDFKKGIKVTTKHLGYNMRKPLRSITGKTARNTSFDCEELGGKVSVEQYFKKSKFGCRLCVDALTDESCRI
jgi:eukaryotic translation initiation factor 2C